MTRVLYERRDTPIFCPVMCHLALAFADNAPKDPYLSKATEAEANEVVNVGIDYIYGLKRRTLVLFVVIHQKEIR